MQQIVIHNQYGGFTVYDNVLARLHALGYCGGTSVIHSHQGRTNPLLVKVINELVAANNGKSYYGLIVVSIPDDVKWVIQEYDGMEWIAEKHRTWDENGELGRSPATTCWQRDCKVE